MCPAIMLKDTSMYAPSLADRKRFAVSAHSPELLGRKLEAKRSVCVEDDISDSNIITCTYTSQSTAKYSVKLCGIYITIQLQIIFCKNMWITVPLY